jgi:hypothetical protein
MTSEYCDVRAFDLHRVGSSNRAPSLELPRSVWSPRPDHLGSLDGAMDNRHETGGSYIQRIARTYHLQRFKAEPLRSIPQIHGSQQSRAVVQGAPTPLQAGVITRL